MKIKKYSNGNQYCLTKSNKLVRNFSKTGVFLDINQTIDSKDYPLFLRNEIQNNFLRSPWIDSEDYRHDNIIIISDGFDFNNKHLLLNDLGREFTVIAVNGALAKWKNSRLPNYYVVNNPYEECIRYLPKNSRVLPKCIASVRTNNVFLRNYKGIKYRYYPVSERGYASMGAKEVKWQVDDYRNPICAAIGLAYHFDVKNLYIFCCDDSFVGERDNAIQLENGLWTYQQQVVAQEIIDANLYWLVNQEHKEISVFNHSSGIIYKNALYIDEDKIKELGKDVKE